MNSTLVLKPEESAEKQKNDIDLIAIAVDVLVPFVLDNFLTVEQTFFLKVWELLHL